MNNNFTSVVRQTELKCSGRHAFRRFIYDRRGSSVGHNATCNIPFTRPLSISCMNLDKKENIFLLCGTMDGSVALTNLCSADWGNEKVTTLIVPSKLNHKKMVTDCQFYPGDMRLFATCSMDHTVKLWDIATLSHLDSFRLAVPPRSLHWNEHCGGQGLIAITNHTNIVHLLDPKSGILQTVSAGNPSSLVTAVQFYPHSHKQLLITGHKDGRMRVFDVRSARRALFERELYNTALDGIKFTDHGLRCVSVSNNYDVSVHDADSLETLFTTKPTQEFVRRKFDYKPIRFTLACDGSRLYAGLPHKENVLWMQLPLEKQHGRFGDLNPAAEEKYLRGHFREVQCCVYRPGIQQLFSAGSDTQLICWANMAQTLDTAAPNVERNSPGVTLHADTWSDEDSFPIR